MKVGIAFLAGLFLLIASTFVVEDLSVFKKEGPEYVVYFQEISGLAVGDPVRYGGFKVGKISEIEVDSEKSLALVTYQIDYDQRDFVKIRENSEHSVEADMFGRAALAISFGTTGSPAVPSKDKIRKDQIPLGITPATIGKVMNSVGEVVDEAKGLPTEVKKLTISLNENQESLLEEAIGILRENRDNIRNFIADMTALAASLANAEGTVGKLIKESSVYDNLDEFMAKASSIGTEVNTFSHSLNEVLRENRRNIKKVTDSLADASPDFEESIHSIRNILAENEENINQIMDDIAEATPKINKSLYDLNIMTGKMARGEGTIGAAIMDDKFKKSVDKTIGSIGTAADEITAFAGGANKLQTFLGIDWRTLMEDRNSQATLYLKIEPSANKLYTLGGTFYVNYPEPEPSSTLKWREAKFEDFTFTALLGWRFMNNHLTLQLGAIESMVGGSLEYSFLYGKGDTVSSQETILHLEFRGMDEDYEDLETEYMLRFLVRHKFGRGISAQVGVEDILNDPKYIIGFVFEYKDEDIKYVAGTI